MRAADAYRGNGNANTAIVEDNGEVGLLRMPDRVTAQNRKMGRPSKYSDELADRAFNLLADPRAYHTKASVALQLRIDEDTLYRWEKEYSYFSESIKQGIKHQEVNLASRLVNGQCNPSGTIFVMKNSAHKWKDKVEEAGSQSIGDVIESAGVMNAVFDPSPAGQPLALPSGIPVVSPVMHELNEESTDIA